MELFRQAIRPGRTKVMLWSGITYKTGTRLPTRLLAELAQEHGLTTVVDYAHGPGMINEDFHALGVDFIGASGEKWQCGPHHTGVYYLRNKVDAAYNPLPLPEFWPTMTMSYPPNDDEDGLPPRGEYDIADMLQYVGSQSLPVIAGFAKSCEVWETIGREKIEKRVIALARAMKEQIVRRWGVEALYSPKDDDRLLSALTSFNPFHRPDDVKDEKKSDEYVRRLEQQHDIRIRNTDFPVRGDRRPHWGVRISTHLFHNYDDVHRVADAMEQVSRQMA